MGSKQEVVAIDVGYGFTKFVWSRNGEEAAMSFPSLAVSDEARNAIPGFEVIRAEPAAPTDRIRVVVGKGNRAKRFAVGTSVLAELPASYEHRSLNGHYADSEDYACLLRGALTVTGATQVETLVLGLPLNTFHAKAQILQDKFAGKIEHLIPMSGGTEYVCHVAKVAVLPQPVAAFIQHQAKNPKSTAGGLTLVIDIGYLTIDWVVTDGRIPMAERSGASNSGMSTIADIVCKAVALEIGDEISVGMRKSIEAALGNRTFSIAVRGKPYNFEKHVKAAEAQAESNLDWLVKRSVGSLADIEKVLVTGGGAGFYGPVAKRYFGDVAVTSSSAQFDIVRGLYTYGQLVSNKK